MILRRSTALKARETPITYEELFDKLNDHEASLKQRELNAAPVAMNINTTQRGRQNNGSYYRSGNNQSYKGRSNSYRGNNYSPRNNSFQNRRRNDSNVNDNKPTSQLCRK